MLMPAKNYELDFTYDGPRVGPMLASGPLVAAASGLGLGLSLIVAIGAQNAFVLRQGIRGQHVGPVVIICALSDAVLIAAAVAGAAALLRGLPWLLDAIRLGGAAFLVGYGLNAARRALRRSALAPATTEAPAGLAATAGTSLALTWLNPHVYLDIMLIGSIAAAHGATRWWFATGVATASTAWFPALGYGARLLRPIFERPASWRLLDALIAAVMTAVAASLVAGAL
jgi:L-lysine exporter family protein LysE/ArgO